MSVRLCSAKMMVSRGWGNPVDDCRNSGSGCSSGGEKQGVERRQGNSVPAHEV